MTLTRRPGSSAASRVTMRQARCSREADVVPLITSFAITGTATGRRIMGSRTRTARTTQLFPKPVFAGPCALPS